MTRIVFKYIYIFKSFSCRKMDAKKAKRMLSQYTGKNDICNIFMKKEGISKSKANTLWDNYVEFMVVKALGQDSGSNDGMKFSCSVMIDELWHCHVLCTERYQEFMELIKNVNPLVDFIHHSLKLSFSSEAEKDQRREATAKAYR